METTIEVLAESVALYLLDDRSTPESATALGEAMRSAVNDEYGEPGVRRFQVVNRRVRDEVMEELVLEILDEMLS
jgi:hypothetical protein